MPTDNRKNLYDYLKNNGRYDDNYSEFSKNIDTPKGRRALYDYMVSEGLYDGDWAGFHNNLNKPEDTERARKQAEKAVTGSVGTPADIPLRESKGTVTTGKTAGDTVGAVAGKVAEAPAKTIVNTTGTVVMRPEYDLTGRMKAADRQKEIDKEQVADPTSKNYFADNKYINEKRKELESKGEVGRIMADADMAASIGKKADEFLGGGVKLETPKFDPFMTKVEPEDYADDMFGTKAKSEEVQNRVQERLSDRELTERLSSQMSNVTSLLNEAHKKEKEQVMSTGGMTPYDTMGESMILEAADRNLRDAQRMVDAANRFSENGSKSDLGSFLKDAGISLVDRLTDFDNWDFGMSNMHDAYAVKDMFDKFDKGGEDALTDSEKALLDAVSMKTAIGMYYGESGVGNQVGTTTAEMIPFMIEMIVNPASGIGQATSSAVGRQIAKYAAKRFLKKGIEEVSKTAFTAGQRALMGAAKYGSRVLADIGAGYVMAGTTGLANVMADTYNRMQGEVIADEKGEYQGRTEGEDFGSAFSKAMTVRAIENQSEFVGNYFKPLLGFLGSSITTGAVKGVNKVVRNEAIKQSLIGAGKAVARVADGAKKNAIGKYLTAMNKYAKYDGPIGEYMEEVVGNFEKAMLGIDMDFSSDKGKGMFNLEDNWATFLSVAVPGVAQAIVSTGAFVRNEMKSANTKLQDENAAMVIGGDAWEAIKSDLNIDYNGTTDAIVKQALAKAREFNLNAEETKALVDYVNANVFSNTWERTKNAKEEEDEDTLQIGIDEANAYGKKIRGNGEKMREAGGNLQQSVEAMQQMPEVKYVIDQYSTGEASIKDVSKAIEGLDAEKKDIASKYLYSVSEIDGVMQSIKDKTAEAADEARAKYMPFARQDENGNNMVTTAKLNGEDVFVSAYDMGNNVLYVYDVNDNGETVVKERYLKDDDVLMGINTKSVDEIAQEESAKVRNEIMDEAQWQVNYSPIVQRTFVPGTDEQNGTVIDTMNGKMMCVGVDNVNGAYIFKKAEVDSRTGLFNGVGEDVVMSEEEAWDAQEDVYGQGSVENAEGVGTPAVETSGETEGTEVETDESVGTQFGVLGAEETLLGMEGGELAKRKADEYLNGDIDEGELKSQLRSIGDGVLGAVSAYIEEKRSGEEAPSVEAEVTPAIPVGEAEGAVVETPAGEAAGTVAEVPAGETTGTDAETVEDKPQMVFNGDEPDFAKSGAEATRGYLYDEEQSGLDKESADVFVENNLNAAKKALDKANKAKSSATNMKQFNEENAKIKAERERAQKEVELWEGVKNGGVRSAKSVGTQDETVGETSGETAGTVAMTDGYSVGTVADTSGETEETVVDEKEQLYKEKEQLQAEIEKYNKVINANAPTDKAKLKAHRAKKKEATELKKQANARLREVRSRINTLLEKEKKAYKESPEGILSKYKEKTIGQDSVTIDEFILDGIARSKFKWNNNKNGTKGLSAHLLSRRSSTERKFYGWLLSEKNGLYPEQVAESIWMDLPEHMQEQYDSMEIFDMMLDYIKGGIRSNSVAKTMRKELIAKRLIAEDGIDLSMTPDEVKANEKAYWNHFSNPAEEYMYDEVIDENIKNLAELLDNDDFNSIFADEIINNINNGIQDRQGVATESNGDSNAENATDKVEGRDEGVPGGNMEEVPEPSQPRTEQGKTEDGGESERGNTETGDTERSGGTPAGEDRQESGRGNDRGLTEEEIRAKERENIAQNAAEQADKEIAAKEVELAVARRDLQRKKANIQKEYAKDNDIFGEGRKGEDAQLFETERDYSKENINSMLQKERDNIERVKAELKALKEGRQKKIDDAVSVFDAQTTVYQQEDKGNENGSDAVRQNVISNVEAFINENFNGEEKDRLLKELNGYVKEQGNYDMLVGNGEHFHEVRQAFMDRWGGVRAWDDFVRTGKMPTRKRGGFRKEPKEGELLPPSDEKELQARFDEQKSRASDRLEGEKNNEYAQSIASANDARGAVSNLANLIKKAADTYNYWSNREYKKNDTVVQVGGKYDDMDYTNMSIGAINERRRENVLKNSRKDAEKYMGYIHTFLNKLGVPESEHEKYLPEGFKTFDELINIDKPIESHISRGNESNHNTEKPTEEEIKETVNDIDLWISDEPENRELREPDDNAESLEDYLRHADSLVYTKPIAYRSYIYQKYQGDFIVAYIYEKYNEVYSKDDAKRIAREIIEKDKFDFDDAEAILGGFIRAKSSFILPFFDELKKIRIEKNNPLERAVKMEEERKNEKEKPYSWLDDYREGKANFVKIPEGKEQGFANRVLDEYKSEHDGKIDKDTGVQILQRLLSIGYNKAEKLVDYYFSRNTSPDDINNHLERAVSIEEKRKSSNGSQPKTAADGVGTQEVGNEVEKAQSLSRESDKAAEELKQFLRDHHTTKHDGFNQINKALYDATTRFNDVIFRMSYSNLLKFLDTPEGKNNTELQKYRNNEKVFINDSNFYRYRMDVYEKYGLDVNDNESFLLWFGEYIFNKITGTTRHPRYEKPISFDELVERYKVTEIEDGDDEVNPDYWYYRQQLEDAEDEIYGEAGEIKTKYPQYTQIVNEQAYRLVNGVRQKFTEDFGVIMPTDKDVELWINEDKETRTLKYVGDKAESLLDYRRHSHTVLNENPVVFRSYIYQKYGDPVTSGVENAYNEVYSEKDGARVAREIIENQFDFDDAEAILGGFIRAKSSFILPFFDELKKIRIEKNNPLKRAENMEEERKSGKQKAIEKAKTDKEALEKVGIRSIDRLPKGVKWSDGKKYDSYSKPGVKAVVHNGNIYINTETISSKKGTYTVIEDFAKWKYSDLVNTLVDRQFMRASGNEADAILDIFHSNGLDVYVSGLRNAFDNRDSQPNTAAERLASEATMTMMREALGDNVQVVTDDEARRMLGIDDGKEMMIDSNTRPTFYSNAERAVADAKMNKGTGEQWLNYLKNNGGLKVEEDKWIGLSEWLKEAQRRNAENGGKGIVTKEDVLKFIAENRLRILDYNYVENPILYEVLDNYNKKFKQYIYEASQEMDENSQPGDWADAAFERLKEEESDADYDFGDAVEINYFTEELEPALDFDDNLSRAGIYYLTNGTKEPINSTRLVYTTEGLKDKREIALAVPSIEPYRADDHVHFGDAGEGRAVAWIRFGDAAAKDGSKVLVIDEIQSERHQGGRERGYKNPGEPGYDELKAEYDAAYEKYKDFEKELADKYGGETEALFKSTREEYNESLRLRDEMEEKFNRYIDYNPKDDRRVPNAPFQKNWHELAMKRMLRYAAENGYDKVAWTTGEQQGDRYDLGNRIRSIKANKVTLDNLTGEPVDNGEYDVFAMKSKDNPIISISGLMDADRIISIYGKDLGNRIISKADEGAGEQVEISGEGLRVGIEGMKTFYDRILPQFMDKYGKKWGMKTESVELNLPKHADRIMHSVDVTPEMRESVIKGQPMFLRTSKGNVYGWTVDGKVYLTESGLNPNTKIHEYTHLWDKALQQTNPELWKKGVELMKQTPVWEEVMKDENYSDIWGDEDKVASEVHSRLSGKEGAERLKEMAEEVLNSDADLLTKAKKLSVIEKLKNWLKEFWWWTKDTFTKWGAKDIKKVSLDDFVNMPLKDLVNGVNPRKRMRLFDTEGDRVTMGSYFTGAVKTTEETDGTDGNTQFSIGSRVEEVTSAEMRRGWDALAGSVAFQLRETAVDYLTAVKKFQDYLSEKLGFKVKDYEDANQMLVKMSGRNKAEMDFYQGRLVPMLVKAMKDLAGKKGNMAALEEYVYVKHGIERNRQVSIERYASKKNEEEAISIMSEWDDCKALVRKSGKTWLEQQRDLDYYAEELGVKIDEEEDKISGLSSMFPDADNWKESAYNAVESYENTHDADKVNGLWDAIRMMTDFALYKWQDSGLVNEDYVNTQKDRFDYYVPLRGFNETLAQDIYDYVGNEYGGFNPVKTMKGRSSRAGDVFGGIIELGTKSIITGNKNLAKMRFLNLVEGHDTKGLTTVSNTYAIRYADIADHPEVRMVYLEPDEEAPEWVVAVPNIPVGADPKEMQRVLSKFEDLMKSLKREGKVVDVGKAGKVDYRTLYNQKNEHQVYVKVGGNTKIVTINGDPRVAQAINGLLNPNNTNENGVFKFLEDVRRFTGGMFTSYNMSFSISNLIRDTQFTMENAFIRNNTRYLTRFMKNRAKNAAPWVTTMFGLYKAGKLDESNYTERMFKEFLDNGGATGYTFTENQKDYADKVYGEIESLITLDGQGKKIAKSAFMGIFRGIQFVTESSEIVNRFATYVTSREMGRSITRSIEDSADNSINFEQKGAGAKTKGKGGIGQKMLVNTLAGVTEYSRRFILFFNAMVQGKYIMLENFKKHPYNTSTIEAGKLLMGGMMMPLINNLALPTLYSVLGIGGDDDEKDYQDLLDDYTRQNNICIRLPKNGGFLTIPVEPEGQALYELGDKIRLHLTGRRDILGKDGAKALVDLSVPYNVNWNYEDMKFLTNFAPSVFQPILQLTSNRNFLNRPIYVVDQYGTRAGVPQYRMVLKNASTSLVELSKWMNELGGGDEVLGAGANVNDRGGVSTSMFDWNPGKLYHLIQGYTGGFGTTIISMADAALALSNGEEFELAASKQPFISRFYEGNSDAEIQKRMYIKYRKPEAFYDLVKSTLNRYKKEANDETNPLLKAEKVERLRRYMDSEDYGKYLLLMEEGHILQIKELEKQRKKYEGYEEVVKNINKQIAINIPFVVREFERIESRE